MKEESDAANAQTVLTPVTASDSRLTANAEQEASATASLLRHIMQIGPARPAVLPEAGGGQSKDGQAAAPTAADRLYPQANSTNTNGWREHASRFSVVVLQTNTRY